MISGRSILLALLVGLALAGSALADTVEDLARKLRSDPDYKVRLSAALNLGKLGDRRAVPALIDALADRDRTVRGVAAAALGKLVDDGVAAELRARALATLARSAKDDPDAPVREQAQKAYDALRLIAPPPPPPPPPPAKGVYVEVGPMADTTRRAPALPALMRQQVLASLGKNAPQFLLRWPSGGSPSEAELASSGATAFYVDGSLTALSVTRAHVTCQLSLLLATFPGKSMFAFLKGGAEVDAASTSEGALAEATSDCVGAVLDDLVTGKLVPTIRARAP